jgi:hypothetical protein
MSWNDPDPIDAFWFAVAPITTGPVAVYSAAGLVSGTYPFGKPDWATSVRNSLSWLAIASSVYGWNMWMSPHNLAWVSGSQAFKTGGYIAAPAAVPVVLLTIAVAAAAGYVSTSDVHMGATGMLVGDMNMGIPVGVTSSGGSSSNIFPGLSEESFWPWNW